MRRRALLSQPLGIIFSPVFAILIAFGVGK